MDTQTYVRKVEDASIDIDTEAAVFSASEAVLSVLSHRITAGQAESLAERLPPELADAVTTAGDGTEEFDLEAFVERVRDREADRGDLDPSQAATHTRAVFSALSEEIGDPWVDATAQLPAEFGELYS